MTILSYYELPEDERPPERIWLDDEAVTIHFEQVEARRDAKFKGESVPEATDMPRNELTEQFRK